MTSPTTPMLLALSGFEPDKLSTNILLINPGWCANSNGNSFAQLTTILYLDMTKNGLNGLDQGNPISGTGYFVYIIKNESTGEVGAVISASIIYSGVVVPSGFTIYRKLRFGFVYDTNRDGIPDFHLSAWPMPIIRLTDAETTFDCIKKLFVLSGKLATPPLISVVPINAQLLSVAKSPFTTSSLPSASW